MSYNISQHTSINKSIGLIGKSTDARSYYFDNDSFLYRPYSSIEEVILYLDTVGSRTGHFPIYISNEGIISEYWFKDGTADQNLILKGDVTQQNIDDINTILTAINTDISGIKDNLSTKANTDDVIDLVADEAFIRESNYNTIQTQINDEAAARLFDDNSLSDRINANGSSISNEISNRIAGDNLLQQNIDISNLNTSNLNTKVNTEISDRTSADTNLQNQVNTLSSTKVDKVTGKGLSTEDYTTADRTKLGGIQTGATANSTDAQLRDRSTHTGTQLSSTISDFNSVTGTSTQTLINNKQPLEDQRLSTTNGISNRNYTVNATDGTGTITLPIQTVQPAAPAASNMKLYYSSDGLTWITPTGFTRGILGTSLTANRVYTLPDKSMTFGDDATVVHRTGALTESIDGNKTFTGIATFSNNFVLSGVAPALTWNTTGNGQSAQWARLPTLNTMALTNSIYQPGAVGKSIQLNIDGRTSGYQYGSFATTGMNASAGTPFTVCFWFRSSSNASNQMIVSFNPSSAGLNGATSEIYIALSNGVLQFSGNGTVKNAGSGLADGQWHYVCLSKGAGTAISVYIDGIVANNQATNMVGIGLNATAFVGNYSSTITSYPFRGEIDGLLIYNYALISDDVATNYNLGAGTAAPVSQSSLYANWPFDEGTGTTAASVNGGTRNITFVNNPTWNAAGKISSVGATVSATGFSHLDGQTNGEKGVSVVGDTSGASVLRGVALRTLINNKNGFTIGRDNNARIDSNYIFDPDSLGSVSPNSRLLIGTGTSAVSQIQLSDSVAVSASSATAGGLYRVGTHIYWVDTTGSYQLDRQAGTSQVLTADTVIQPNVRYYVNPATNIVLNLTLPTTFAIDDFFIIFGKTGTFKIVQNASQIIRSVQYSTTAGTGGSLTSTNQYCTLSMRGLTANTELLITTIQGTFNPI